MNENSTTVAIIGGGPAGLTAALYLGRAKINCLVIDKDMCGGQIISSPLLENVPGFYGPGVDLAMNMLEEISKYPSVQFANFSKVVKVNQTSKDSIEITLEDGAKITSRYVICATGSDPIRLPRLESDSTHYCVTCDGPLYENKPVAVIGGGNSALQYALELTKYASSVKVITNEPILRGEEEMRQRVLNHPLINVVCNFTADKFENGVLTSTYVTQVEVSGIFIAIGYRPNTDYLDVSKGDCFMTNSLGQIFDGREYSKSIYAVGDCRLKSFNQVVIAMADGCTAALSIIRDLEK